MRAANYGMWVQLHFCIASQKRPEDLKELQKCCTISANVAEALYNIPCSLREGGHFMEANLSLELSFACAGGVQLSKQLCPRGSPRDTAVWTRIGISQPTQAAGHPSEWAGRPPQVWPGSDFGQLAAGTMPF